MERRAVKAIVREMKERHARMSSRGELQRQIERLRLTTAPPVATRRKD